MHLEGTRARVRDQPNKPPTGGKTDGKARTVKRAEILAIGCEDICNRFLAGQAKAARPKASIRRELKARKEREVLGNAQGSGEHLRCLPATSALCQRSALRVLPMDLFCRCRGQLHRSTNAALKVAILEDADFIGITAGYSDLGPIDSPK
jgi:hypothetical protein